MARLRSTARARVPWASRRLQKAYRNDMAMHAAKQQSLRFAYEYSTFSTRGPLRARRNTDRGPFGLSVEQSGAGSVHSAGLLSGPLLGQVPAPVFLFNNGDVVFMSQNYQLTKRASRRRRRRSTQKILAARQRDAAKEVCPVCPPAPLLNNEFYMRRAEEERAAAAHASQAGQALVPESRCPPASFLSNEYYMQRAEQQRADALQQQRVARAEAWQEGQLAVAVAHLQLHEPVLPQLQLPCTPDIADQRSHVHVSRQLSDASSSMISATAVGSSRVGAVAHPSMPSKAEHTKSHMALQAEEEVCTWDPGAMVVIESF